MYSPTICHILGILQYDKNGHLPQSAKKKTVPGVIYSESQSVISWLVLHQHFSPVHPKGCQEGRDHYESYLLLNAGNKAHLCTYVTKFFCLQACHATTQTSNI